MSQAEVNKGVIVEPGLANDQLMHAREKSARLGSLNDAVIVGAADSDGFTNAELRQSFRRHRLILGRIFNSRRSR